MRRGLHRGLVALAFAGCAPAPAPPEPPPTRWVYAPPLRGWGLGDELGRLGRGQAPQLVEPLGITGAANVAPLRAEHVWPVPGDGAARALIASADTAEMIDVDAGRVVWRAPCVAAAVARDVVVCRDAAGVRALAIADGAARWTNDAALVAASGERVILDRGGAVRVTDAASGQVLVDSALPAGVRASDVRASCGADGRQLFASRADGALVRLDAGIAGPAKLAWAASLGPLAALDACAANAVRATTLDGDARAITAVDRASGKLLGRVTGVLGAWPARGGGDRVEIASASGVASWPEDLAGASEMLALPPLGELVASRGDRRLVRVTPMSAVLLDRRGVRALIALGDLDAVLGDRAIVATSATGDVRRFAIPPPFSRRVRGWHANGVAVPAELRDLPARADLDRGVDAPGGDGVVVSDLAIDPGDPAALYALVGAGSDASAGLARVDLRARAWTWLRTGACPRGSFAIAADVVICGGATGVRALGKDGAPRWTAASRARALLAAGDVALAIDGAHATALDARDGHVLGGLASDDGAEVRAALVAIDGVTWLVAAERGRIVARLPSAAMLAVWSRPIDGVVRAISASADAVLVELDDGDADRVDVRTGDVIAMPALGQRWTAFADTLVGQTRGGPLPPADLRWVPPPPKPVPAPLHPPPVHLEIESPPPFTALPWPAPPATPASVQLTWFDPTGGVRARDDYALGPASVVATARGPAGSPIVVADGIDLLALDAVRGDPIGRAAFPIAGAPFATVVDGRPIAGAIVGAPLRLVLLDLR